MSYQAFDERFYELSVTVGMNQRYRAAKIKYYERYDLIAKVSLGFIAVLGAVCTILGQLPVSKIPSWMSSASLGSAVVTLISLGVLNAIPFQKKISIHQDFLDLWSRLRKHVNDFEIDVERGRSREDQDSDELYARLKELTKAKDDINSREKDAADEKLLEACLVKEERARGVDVEIPPSWQMPLLPNLGTSGT